MSIVKSNSRKATNTKASRFSIAIDENTSVEFRPTATFAHVTPKQVMKIIAKADIGVTAENLQGQVNFKFSITGKSGAVKNAGFINYWENDLDDESTTSEINSELKLLQASLRKVKLGDISLPMTASEADSMIDDL
jgi:hypothetical protein